VGTVASAKAAAIHRAIAIRSLLPIRGPGEMVSNRYHTALAVP
jgi:hypothetical protein